MASYRSIVDFDNQLCTVHGITMKVNKTGAIDQTSVRLNYFHWNLANDNQSCRKVLLIDMKPPPNCSNPRFKISINDQTTISRLYYNYTLIEAHYAEKNIQQLRNMFCATMECHLMHYYRYTIDNTFIILLNSNHVALSIFGRYATESPLDIYSNSIHNLIPSYKVPSIQEPRNEAS